MMRETDEFYLVVGPIFDSLQKFEPNQRNHHPSPCPLPLRRGVLYFLRDLCVLCGEMALLRVTVALEKAKALK